MNNQPLLKRLLNLVYLFGLRLHRYTKMCLNFTRRYVCSHCKSLFKSSAETYHCQDYTKKGYCNQMGYSGGDETVLYEKGWSDSCKKC